MGSNFRLHFKLADELVAHLKPLAAAERDPRVLGLYAGFVAVMAVTSYELAIRELMLDFATARSPEFSSYLSSKESRLNGRIAPKEIRERFLSSFGGRYLARFERLLKAAEKGSLRRGEGSIGAAYGNVIAWRHEFAHQGRPPANATFAEACESFERGKQFLDCLGRSLYLG